MLSQQLSCLVVSVLCNLESCLEVAQDDAHQPLISVFSALNRGHTVQVFLKQEAIKEHCKMDDTQPPAWCRAMDAPGIWVSNTADRISNASEVRARPTDEQYGNQQLSGQHQNDADGGFKRRLLMLSQGRREPACNLLPDKLCCLANKLWEEHTYHLTLLPGKLSLPGRAPCCNTGPVREVPDAASPFEEEICKTSHVKDETTVSGTSIARMQYQHHPTAYDHHVSSTDMTDLHLAALQEAWRFFVSSLRKTARRKPTRTELQANISKRLSKRTIDGSLPPDAFDNNNSLPASSRAVARPTAEEAFKGHTAKGDQAV